MIQSIGESIDFESGPLLDEELDQCSSPNWEKYPPLSHNFLNGTLPSDEAILEVMTLLKDHGKTLIIDLVFFLFRKGWRKTSIPLVRLTSWISLNFHPLHTRFYLKVI